MINYEERRISCITESRTSLSFRWFTESGVYRKETWQKGITGRIECIGGLREAGYDVLRSMHQEHVCYAEIRFAPLLSETSDMDCRKVIEAVIAGMNQGKQDFGVEYGIITCAMRHHSAEENLRMLRIAREYLGEGVCAADLAGAEALYPMSEFMDVFQTVKKLGMPFTLNAGECGNVRNIIDSVEAGAGRIGHGIAMRGHGGLQAELAQKGIGIEMCPISNLQTKAVQRSIHSENSWMQG